ncbi:rpl10e [Gossypium arboreum]|uniref:Rpl10e n=1 Tax=Gossypium arboreum TaxID=29729 RepID=A0A0B0N800_GOSAR|nr:rpl10e [Gossypium arboreum]
MFEAWHRQCYVSQSKTMSGTWHRHCDENQCKTMSGTWHRLRRVSQCKTMFGTWHRPQHVSNVRPCLGHGIGNLPSCVRLIGYPLVFQMVSRVILKLMIKILNDIIML